MLITTKVFDASTMYLNQIGFQFSGPILGVKLTFVAVSPIVLIPGNSKSLKLTYQPSAQYGLSPVDLCQLTQLDTGPGTTIPAGAAWALTGVKGAPLLKIPDPGVRFNSYTQGYDLYFDGLILIESTGQGATGTYKLILQCDEGDAQEYVG